MKTRAQTEVESQMEGIMKITIGLMREIEINEGKMEKEERK